MSLDLRVTEHRYKVVWILDDDTPELLNICFSYEPHEETSRSYFTPKSKYEFIFCIVEIRPILGPFKII